MVLSRRNNSNKAILKTYHTYFEASEKDSGVDCITSLIVTVILTKRQSITSNFFDQFSRRPCFQNPFYVLSLKQLVLIFLFVCFLWLVHQF